MPKEEQTQNTKWERKLKLIKPRKAATEGHRQKESPLNQKVKPMTDIIASLQQNTLKGKWLHKRTKAMFGATS